MRTDRFLDLVDALAPTLRSLDALLADPHPGAHAKAPAFAGLDAACGELHRQVQSTVEALHAVGEFAAAADDDELDAARVGAGVARAANGLGDAYRGIARLSHSAGRDARHERLADVARDNVVAMAHLLADVIGSGLALMKSLARSAGWGERECAASFDAPATANELDTWTPLRLAYARDLASRALRDAQTGRRDLAPPAASAPATSPRRCPGLGLTAIIVGLLIGSSLGGDHN